MSNHYQIEIEQQPIELYKLLKIANLVSGGGEAKVLISEGYVLLNGEVETQKRKKILSGDIIEFNGDLLELVCHNEPIFENKAEKTKSISNNEKLNNKKKTHQKNNKQSKRKNTSPVKQPKSNKPIANENASGQRRSIKF